jgi:hypothetical protein
VLRLHDWMKRSSVGTAELAAMRSQHTGDKRVDMSDMNKQEVSKEFLRMKQDKDGVFWAVHLQTRWPNCTRIVSFVGLRRSCLVGRAGRPGKQKG